MPEHLKPGETAPATAVYRVQHYAHRLPHDALVRAGQVLPHCNVCGEHVRFKAVVVDPKLISQDPDLRRAG